jgi:N-acetylmuramoyl-L-alanine amidase
VNARARAQFRRSAAILVPTPTRIRIAALAVALALAALTAVAAAQERHNFLAVEDAIVDDAGPYYFVAYGDSSNAYAKAAPLAAAMGVELDYDGGRSVLIFDDGYTRVEVDVTRDVRAGLERRPGTVRIDGAPFPRDVPRGILIDGTSYVAITPLAEAFGGTASWHADARVIDVSLPARSAATGSRVAEPRIGRHDGFTRVALDVPEEQDAQLLVSDGSVALVLPGARFESFDRDVDAASLQRIYRDVLGGDEALVMVVDHAVDEAGRGYRMGRTGNGVVYVDLGPDVAGDPAAGRAPEARAAAVPAAAAPPQARRQVVVIDAGHGGHDPGTVSDWAREEAIVLDVALKLQGLLESQGVEVILTRDHDTFLTLQERSTFATTERNVFVSIHANAAPTRDAHGVETWVFGRPLDPSQIDRAIRENGGGEIGAALTAEAAQSADIAGDILRETQLNYSMGLAELVQDRLVRATGARDRGVRQNLFYVIRNSRIPAILVEVGFVSHPDEGRKLMEDGYRDDIADALADGILDFLRGGGSGAELAQR